MATYGEFCQGAIYWTECLEAEVPVDDLWLTPLERLHLFTLKIPKRRTDWRLGRWTAKRAVHNFLQKDGREPPISSIEVRVRESGAPYAMTEGEQVNISLSHSHGVALCVVSRSTAPIGCDVEFVEPRSNSFVNDYLTPTEQACISETAPDRQKHALVTLFWSAKESALKALGFGLRLDVARLNVSGDFCTGSSGPEFSGKGWQSMNVAVADLCDLGGWWSYDSGFIRTVITEASGHCLPMLAERRN